MKVCGLICEYNPFHNGHLHHIQQARRITKCDCLVVVLSGNYVQRGDYSILNKWEKTKLALQFGCDLVIELPYFYAVQSANYFAKYAMQLIKLAKIDYLVFGSESNDLVKLIDLSKLSITNWDIYQKEGYSYAKTYETFFGKLYANDILAINYLKHIDNITPFSIQRTNHYHDLSLQKIASASAIRHAIQQDIDVSDSIPYTFQFNYKSISQDYPIIRNKLLTLPKSTLQSIFLVDEGIESLFIKSAQLHCNYDDFINYCVSKRYTRSKIQRTLVHILLHTQKKIINTLPKINYIRILGMNPIGRKHLKTLDCVCAVNINQIPNPFRDLEIIASYQYYGELPKFEIEKPIIIK